jgi:hypothetical protein
MNKLRQIGKYSLLRRWSPLVLSVIVPIILLALIMLSGSTAEAEQMELQAEGLNSAILVLNVGDRATDISVLYSDDTANEELGLDPWESVVFTQEWEDHEPGWAGGAAVDSIEEPVVALVNQYAPGKESIYNAFGFYDAPTSFVLPIVMNNYFGLNTTVFVQNVGTGDAKVMVYYSDGLERSETIVPGDTAILVQAEEDHADEWFGSAFVEADQPIVAVVNQESEVSFRTYRGFPYAFGRSRAFSKGILYRPLQQAYLQSLPLIKKDWAGSGDSTAILVHNLSDSEATVAINFYDESGAYFPGPTGAIPPDGFMSFPQMGDQNLPDPFRGSAEISSDQPVVALVGQGALDSSFYEGFEGGSTAAVLPLVQKEYYGCNTQIAIQNVGAVDPANVWVTYEGEADGTPVAVTEEISGLLPYASAFLEQAYNPDLPTGFSGYAIVEASSPVAAVVNYVCIEEADPVYKGPSSPETEGTLSTYNGVDLYMTNDDAFAPAVMYEYQSQQGPVISGGVVNPDGSPIVGDSWVCLYHINPTNGEWVDLGCVTAYGLDSQGDGYFEFPTPDQYTPGDFVVTAEAPWDSGFFDAVPVDFYLDVPGTFLDLGFLPLTYASFEGMVYEPDGETPASLGYVEVYDLEGDWVAGGEYESGYYEIGGVPEGDFTLVAYPPDGSAFGESEPLTVTVRTGSQYEPGNTQYYDLVLTEVGPTLTVDIEPWDAEEAGCWVDQDLWSPYAFGDQVTLEAKPCTGWVFDHWAGDLAGTTDALATIVMDGDKTVTAHYVPGQGPEAQLVVYVYDPQQARVAAHVKLWSESGAFWYDDWSDSSPEMPAQFPTNAGEYLPSGYYWVQAWPVEDDIPDLANSMKEWIYIGDYPHSVDLFLQYPDVVGVVTTPEGGPLPPAYQWGAPSSPAEVYVHNEYGDVDIWMTTNISGEFSLAVPYYDTYYLVAMPLEHSNLAESYTKSLPEKFAAPIDGTVPQQLVLEVPLTYPRVWGWVIGPDGNPVSTWVDVWSDDTGYWDGDQTDWYPEDEYYKPFRLGGMLEGDYLVQSQPPEDTTLGLGKSNVEDFVVESGSQYDPSYTEQITLYIGVANFIGTLMYPNEDPVPWVEVGIYVENGDFYDSTETGEDGGFTFSGLDPWVSYTVEVYLPDWMMVEWAPPPPVTFILESPDQQIRETLFLQPIECDKYAFGEIIYDDNGDAVDDALVYAHHETSGQWAEIKTEADGSYQLCLGSGMWKMGVEPLSSDADWWFDSNQEQWVWFGPLPVEDPKEVNFTVNRYNATERFWVTGIVTTPLGAVSIPAGAVGIDLCTEDGDACFGADVASNGEFSLLVPPDSYEAWVWVDAVAGVSFPFDEPLYNGRIVDVFENPQDIGVFYLRSTEGRTAQVSGRVIISRTQGQGLAGVEIGAWTEDDEGIWYSTETITGGYYTLQMFPGYWHGGPFLTEAQEEDYLVLPPRFQSGEVAAGETISNVNFFLLRRDASISGRIVDEDDAVLTEVDAIVFAEYCTDGECWTISEDEVRNGAFELHVVGGTVYTLGVWLPTAGEYAPGPPKYVEVAVGEDKTGVLLTLLDAGTRIWGDLKSDNPDDPYPQIEASIFGSAPGEQWVEDTLWPDKDPYQYNLYVPTPVSDTVTWTLGLWVDPSTGYIAHPAYPSYPVVIAPELVNVPSTMFVMKLDTVIEGTVSTTDGKPAPKVGVFAEGVEGTDSANLYFEATTDVSGTFSMQVLPGEEYVVGAYLPPNLAATHLPPKPLRWTSVFSNPVNIVLLPKTEEVEIVGALSVSPTTALPASAVIEVFGWTEEGHFSEVTGTLNSQYHLPVVPNTTWRVWAAYEDSTNADFYRCRERIVRVGDVTETGVDLLLERAFELPASQCWNVDPNKSERFEFPRRSDLLDLLPPMLTVQAGTFSETVNICATPVGAVPQGQHLIGFAYELEARDGQGKLITKDFNKYVRLEFYFDDDALRTVPSYPYPTAADLTPAFFSTVYNRWMPLDDAFVDEEAGYVNGKINHFSRMGVRTGEGVEGELYLPTVLRNH